jgi:hypothetical protein
LQKDNGQAAVDRYTPVDLDTIGSQPWVGDPAALVQRERGAAATGATWVWRWGAPIATEKTPGRRRAPDGLNGGHLGRRRRHTVTDGKRRRRRKTGELVWVLRSAGTCTKCIRVLLTSMRSSWAASSRRRGDGRRLTSGGGSRVCAAVAKLGG